MRSTTFVGVVGGLYVWLTFGVYWILPRVTEIPAMVALAGGVVAVGTGLLVVREFQSGSRPHRLALATGLLSFLLVFSVVVELTGDVLAILATAAIVYLLLWLRRTLPTSEVTVPPGALVGPA
jgi:chromate transport protein ChrA